MLGFISTATAAAGRQAAVDELEVHAEEGHDDVPVDLHQKARQGMLLEGMSDSRARINDDFESELTKLIETLRKRSKRLTNSLERTDEVEEAPSYVAYLQGMPSRELVSTLCLPQVNGRTSIIVALRALRSHPALLVRISATRRDYLLSRTALVEYVVGVSDLFQPIASIVNEVPELPVVSADDTLAKAWHVMLIHGCGYVGTTNTSGTVYGVVSSEDIEDVVMEMLEQELPPMENKDQFRDMAEMDGEEGVTATALEARKNERTRMRKISKLQRVAQEWVEAAWTEILVLLLVLLDLSLTIYELVADLDEYADYEAYKNPMNVVTGSILFVFAFEAGVRLYGFRIMLFYRVLDVIDLMVVIASILVFLLVITEVSKNSITSVVTAARVMRFLRLVKIIKQIRKMVKANRNRYQRHGFNLDLCFVTPQCIAMSVPAAGVEATYRNPIEEVQRFFQTLHPDRYRIFNLCPERQYDHSYFSGRVEDLRVEHHHPPTIEQVLEFLRKTSTFLDEDPLHVVAVHCLSGLSRTGIFVSAWLMHSTFSQNAEDAMEWFAQRRRGSSVRATDAITQPSQRRYVLYMEDVIARGGYRVNRLTMHRLVIKTIPNASKHRSGCTPSFSVEEKGYVIYEHKRRARLTEQHPSDLPSSDAIEFDDLNITMEGDIRVTIYDCTSDKERVLCFFWFHTGFIEQERTVMAKNVIDMACADTKHHLFHQDFQVEICFEGVPLDDGTSGTENFVRVGGNTVESAPSLLSQERSGTELGSWNRLDKPSKRIIEIAQRNRGLTQVALNRGEKVTVTLEDETEQQTFSLVPLQENLCIASGAPVLHEPVELFQYAGASMHAHRHSKNMSKNNFNPTDFFARAARTMVSGQKKRFQEDGFDLDLTYITPRLIAMGFPSSGMEKQYRNSEDEVYRFFQERHAGHYRIVNLCSERAYDLNVFHGSVVRYPFPDHNPPAMELIGACCGTIHEWLQEDSNNVVAVHCKAGKGRTGLMIVAMLMYGGLANTAIQARAFYDSQRTYNKKGLTIISQIRYAHYFEEQLRRRKSGEEVDVRESESPAMILDAVVLHRVPKLHRDGGCDPILTVAVKKEISHEVVKLWTSADNGRPPHIKQSDGRWRCPVGEAGNGVRVAGDVQLHFSDYDPFFKAQKICQVWLHTHFWAHPPSDMGGSHRVLTEAECAAEGLKAGAHSLTLHKHEIDVAAADRKCVKFEADFTIEVFFRLTNQRGTGAALLREASSLDTTRTPTGGGGGKQAVLYFERDAYERDRQQRAVKGHAQITFEEWQELDKSAKARVIRGAATPGGKGRMSKSASIRTPPAAGTPRRSSLSRSNTNRTSGPHLLDTSELGASLAGVAAAAPLRLASAASSADLSSASPLRTSSALEPAPVSPPAILPANERLPSPAIAALPTSEGV